MQLKKLKLEVRGMLMDKNGNSLLIKLAVYIRDELSIDGDCNVLGGEIQLIFNAITITTLKIQYVLYY